MHQYELMVILDPDMDERTVAPSLDKFLGVVRNDGGTIENVDIWGKRRLAYEINKKSEGVYAVVNFTATPATTKELDRQLGLSESVMRTKVLRAEEATFELGDASKAAKTEAPAKAAPAKVEAPAAPAAEAAAPAEEKVADEKPAAKAAAKPAAEKKPAAAKAAPKAAAEKKPAAAKAPAKAPAKAAAKPAAEKKPAAKAAPKAAAEKKPATKAAAKPAAEKKAK